MFLSGGLRATIAALFLLLGGCAGKHVTFFSQNVASNPPGENRIFLDARGHLYPKTGLAADSRIHKKHKGSLFEAARDRTSGLCSNAGAGTEMAMLCARIAPDECRDWLECAGRWEEAQQDLWLRRGREIASQSARNGDSMIVFLIHGFNNWYEESQPNFDMAETALRAAAPAEQKIRFVEVFWDGCRGLDIGVGCWGRAQATGPLAGFSLRQLLNGIDTAWPPGADRPHMRILTHSSGAFVAGAIVGSPIAALPLLRKPEKNARYRLFSDHRSAEKGPYRVPQPRNLRIGMLAAATPYVTYSGSRKFRGGATVGELTLLISVQPRDSAITKMGIGCSRFGASCLGAQRQDVCDLKHALENMGKKVGVTGYDFARDRKLWGRRATLHAFSVYIEQASQHSSFFRDLMAVGAPGQPAGTGRPFECPE